MQHPQVWINGFDLGSRDALYVSGIARKPAWRRTFDVKGHVQAASHTVAREPGKNPPEGHPPYAELQARWCRMVGRYGLRYQHVRLGARCTTKTH